MNDKIEREVERLSSQTGINFVKYRRPGLVEKIGNLIGFAGSVRNLLAGCYGILLFIVIVLCVYFILQGMKPLGVGLFFCVGAFFSASAGTALVTMKVAEKAVRDTIGVTVLLLDFSKEVRRDVSDLLKNKPGEGLAPSDLFKGLSFSVFIPAISQAVNNKVVSLLAKSVNFIACNTMYHFTNYLAPQIDKTTDKISGMDTGAEGAFDRSVDDLKYKIEPAADSVIRKIKIPGKLLLTFSIIGLLPILLIIFLLF